MKRLTNRSFILLLLTFAFSASFFVTPTWGQDPGDVRWEVTFPRFETTFTEDSATGSVSFTNHVTAVADDGTIYYIAGSTQREGVFSLYSVSPEGNIQWEREFSKQYNSSQIIPPWLPSLGPDGTVYVHAKTASNELTLSAYNPDGSLRGTYSYSPEWVSTEGISTRLDQMIGSDGTVYFSTLEEAVALNPDLSHKWTFDNYSNFFCWGIGPNDNLYCGGSNAGLFSLSSSGEIREEFQLEVSDDTSGQTSGSASFSAISSEGNLFFLNPEEDVVFAIDNGGSPKWSFDNDGQLNIPSTQFSQPTDLIVSESGNLIFGDAENETLYALDASTGELQWTQEIPFSGPSSGTYSSLSLSQGQDGTLYVKGHALINFSIERELVALNPEEDQALQWSYQPNNLTSGAVKVDSGNVYVTYTKGSRATGDRAGIRALAVGSEGPDEGPWAIGGVSDNKNTYRAGSGAPEKSCDLKPKIKLVPKFIFPNFGFSTLFITGFEDSDVSHTDVKPSTVTLANADAKRWWSVRPFTMLKFTNRDLEYEREDGKWFSTAPLTIEGETKDGGCFKAEKEVFVWG